MEEIKRIIPFVSDQNPKKVPEKKTDIKKKIELLDKDGLYVTGGLFPIYPQSSQNPDKGQVKTNWQYAPIVYSKNSNTNLYHWVPENEKDRVFQYEKFIIQSDIVTFTKEEYNVHLSNIDDIEQWNYDETMYLWDLCASFNLRWPIIYDRYDYAKYLEQKANTMESENQKEDENPKVIVIERTMEELKARYYHLAKRILNAISFFYKLRVDIVTRGKVIKKEEKEQLNLQKILKMNQDELDEHEQGNEEFNFQKLTEEKQVFRSKKEKICYLRGTIMHTPLPISSKLNKKLQLALQELNIAIRPHPTQKNEELYDMLREKLLMMFSLQKHLKRKDIERKILEDKLMPFRTDSLKKVMKKVKQD